MALWPGWQRRLAVSTMAIIIGIVLTVYFGNGCGTPEISLDDAVCEPQNLQILPFESLPNLWISQANSDAYNEPLDADSIEMFAYRGGVYYHPTLLSRRCQEFIATYRTYGDDKHLARAEHYLRKLMSECIEVDGALFATLPFDFAVHGDSTILMTAPWFSGMTQGEMLMAAMRLYEVTQDTTYLEFGHRLFKAYTRLRGPNEIWFARLDSAGFYWIEEYPHADKPGETLNGFGFGIYGLYDYIRITGSDEARRIFDLAVTTIKHYVPYFRQKDELSLYCLGHRTVTNGAYHGLHIQQMDFLKRMTGDPFFDIISEVLREDAEAADAAGK